MAKNIEWADQQRVIRAIIEANEEAYFKVNGELYMKYDKQELDMRNRQLRFSYKGAPVAKIDELEVGPDDVLTVHGLFGGIKVEINSK